MKKSRADVEEVSEADCWGACPMPVFIQHWLSNGATSTQYCSVLVKFWTIWDSENWTGCTPNLTPISAQSRIPALCGGAISALPYHTISVLAQSSVTNSSLLSQVLIRLGMCRNKNLHEIHPQAVHSLVLSNKNKARTESERKSPLLSRKTNLQKN